MTTKAGAKDIKQHAATIWKRLKERWPDARCTLDFKSPLELLVAAVLSAQCTDERVNQVTKGLFRKYKTARDYASAKPQELEQDIRSTGFYRNKAKNILGAAKILQERHEGRVPDTMDELVELPGVARKTANVLLGTAFGKAEGVVVDTHVHRLSRRLALTEHDDPVKIERDLMALFPRRDWTALGHTLVLHGRHVCRARKPLCGECVLNDICPSSER
ncbi:MAG: endonuclease III [Acidobacteriota bacterium]|nr:MAG: endonuclease III [Acidobacteriota bacterium]